MLLYVLGMFGIAAFAITGVISAGRRNMDIFSIVLLGMVASLGGGTIRDVVLRMDAVYWVEDTSYLWIAIVSSVFAFFGVLLLASVQWVTKDSIAEYLWGDYMDDAFSYDFIYAHVKNLRKKLVQNDCGDYLKTVYGVGYKFISN